MFDINECIIYFTCCQAKEMGDVLNDKLMEFGITKTQWYCLYYLGLSERMNVCELANKMRIKHSSATRLISRMEKEGYIKKEKDKDDKRITYVMLTDKAIEIRNKVLPVCMKFHEEAIKNISNDEINNFKEVLQSLTNNVIDYSSL